MKSILFPSLISSFLCLLSALPTKAVTIVQNNNALDLVNTLIGTNSGITIVGTPTFIGNAQAAGTFTNGNVGTKLGIDSGIVLGTGPVTNAPGTYSINGAGTTFNTLGDPQLTALAGAPTIDAAILSFDFTTTTGNLYLLNYVFASQEYSQYVGTQYNDVFTYSIDGVNIALVPGTNQPVSVNTINNGLFEQGIQNSNPELFISNRTNTLGTIYGGQTVPLSASLTNLSPGVHNFRIAIADAADGNLDSSVFLQSGTISAFPGGIPNNNSTNVPEPLTVIGTIVGGIGGVLLRRRVKKSPD
jgi:hypothetical protein